MRVFFRFFVGALLLGGTACRKEVEKIVVQERQYSWTASKEFFGNFSILLGAGKGPNGLYFQQPAGFAALEGSPAQPLRLTQYLFAGSTDIAVRYPIGRDFFVACYDSLVTIVPTQYPVTSGAGGYFYLSRLDPQARRVQPNLYTFNKLGAISPNNYVLLPYERLRADGKNHLVLAHVTTVANFNYPVYRADTRLLELPIQNGGSYPSMPTLLTAFDGYFLVDCGSEGVYKITESGAVRQVLPAYTRVNAFFKLRGKLWATLSGSQLAVSANEGDTWQLTTSGPNLPGATFQAVGDSLVGIEHALGGTLFTFDADQARQRWRIRPLRSDGLNRTAINDLQTWGDTVYLATSSGLFKRPLSHFFDSQP